jgi:hypothetical protein
VNAYVKTLLIGTLLVGAPAGCTFDIFLEDPADGLVLVDDGCAGCYDTVYVDDTVYTEDTVYMEDVYTEEVVEEVGDDGDYYEDEGVAEPDYESEVYVPSDSAEYDHAADTYDEQEYSEEEYADDSYYGE